MDEIEKRFAQLKTEINLSVHNFVRDTGLPVTRMTVDFRSVIGGG